MIIIIIKAGHLGWIDTAVLLECRAGHLRYVLDIF